MIFALLTAITWMPIAVPRKGVPPYSAADSAIEAVSTAAQPRPGEHMQLLRCCAGEACALFRNALPPTWDVWQYQANEDHMNTAALLNRHMVSAEISYP